MGFEGTWEVTVSDTPSGNFGVDLVIEKNNDQYVGYMVNGSSKVDIQKLTVQDRKLNLSFFSAEYGIDVNIDAELQEGDNAISGWVMDSYKLSGTRKMAEKKWLTKIK